MKLYLTPIGTGKHQGESLLFSSNGLIFLMRWYGNDWELLQEPDQGIRDFHQRKILTQTCPWPPIEWEIRPADICQLTSLPSLRTKFVSVRSVNVLTSSIDVRREDDNLASSYEYGRVAVRSTTSGKDRSLHSSSIIQGHRWIKTEACKSKSACLGALRETGTRTLFDHTSKIGHPPYLFSGGMCRVTNDREDLFPQSFHNPVVTDQKTPGMRYG